MEVKCMGKYQNWFAVRQAQLTKYRQIPLKVPNVESVRKSTCQRYKITISEVQMKASEWHLQLKKNVFKYCHPVGGKIVSI